MKRRDWLGIDYREWHRGEESFGAGYDETLFTDGSYDYEIWKWERELLSSWVEKWVPVRGRYLDFACGTGRVLSFLERSFEESVGVDISETMLQKARQVAKHSSIVAGDVTREPGLASGGFDCITAFRFFLNAQPSLRDEAMASLVSRLAGEESVLIFNVHGNRWSSRWLPARTGRLRQKIYNEMSLSEVRTLTSRHGLQIVDWTGIGYVDGAYFKFMPDGLWHALERFLAGIRFPKRFAVNLYFVCRRSG